MPARLYVVVMLIVLAGAPAGAGHAQATGPAPRGPVATPHGLAPGGEPTLDVRVLRSVYTAEAPAFRGLMRGADWTAYPVFVGAPVAAWGGAWLLRDGDDWTDAYRLTVAQVATYGAVKALKELIRRPRPYAALPDIQSRSARYSPSGPEGASFAFPSGHAAMAFAIATSWSLSHPEWYVIAPSAAWATSVALSRVWLGVHYPSDVVAGALLGAGLSTAVHLLRDAITPGRLEPRAASGASLRLRF